MNRLIQFLVILTAVILAYTSCSTPGSSPSEPDVSKQDKTYTSSEYLDLIRNGSSDLFLDNISSGAIDLEWADPDGAGYLHHAVWEGSKEIVSALIEAGADVEARRNDGYTPLHWAAYRDYPEIAEMLLNAGADPDAEANSTTPLLWAASKESNKTAMVLLEHGADINIAGVYTPSPMDYYTSRYGDDVKELYRTYGSSVIASVFENPGATKNEKPSQPPYPEAQMEFDGVFNYLDSAVIRISVSNNGKGALYQVAASIGLRGTYKVYFGLIEPGQTVTRAFSYKYLKVWDCGQDIPVSVNFSEANDYAPEALNGKISVAAPDNAFIVEYLPDMPSGDIRTCMTKNYFSQNDLNRAVFLRGEELGMEKLKDLVNKNLVDRTVIDKLIRYNKINYSIEDIIFFAQKKAISQENLELVLLENRIDFTAEDIISIAKARYISRQVVEAIYTDGLEFSSQQIRELISLRVFSLPEVLYTYTITDDNSGGSVGNGDGMIQIKEGVDFEFVIKNNSIFDLSDVKVALSSHEGNIDLFNNASDLASIKSGETVSVVSTIAVKPAFKGDSFSLSISINDSYFGALINRNLTIPVGRTVGSKILTLNKKIATTENVIVRNGASEDSPQMAAFSEGAVLDAVGELGEWYKVGVYGKYGWIKKAQVTDFTQKTDSTFLVENRSDFALEEGSGEYSERLFVNSRPELVILSPSNNDNVYNRVQMEILAIDQSFGISYVDIRVNGESVSGSDTRGLRVVDTENRELRKSYSISLKKGENDIAVTAYNAKNVASDTKEITLYSQGVQNPPSLYALTIGVSRYQNPEQNLAYAASDATTIAEVFRNQENSDIYDKVEIKTLLDEEATRSNIIDGINNFLSNARSDDVAVLFFAGHGITDSKGRYFLLGHDAEMDNPSANGLSQSAFEEDLLAAVQARKVIIMLDSCQSGGVTGRRGSSDISAVVENLSDATGFTIISAARGNEYAYENPEWKGGAFTKAIEDALQNDKADANGDGFVDINELDSFVYERVIELTNSKQHPTSKRFSAESYQFYQIQ